MRENTPEMGELFVFEGPDGVGKTTLAQRFTALLQERDVAATYLSFPGRAPNTLGYHIYQLHHNPSQFAIENLSATSLQVLHIACHIDAIDRIILPALRRGETIVLDRFWWSTVAYGRFAGVPDHSLEAMVHLEIEHWGSVKPNAAFLVRRPSPLRPENLEQWSKVSEAYLEILEKEHHRYPATIIDNIASIEESLAAIDLFIQKELKGTWDGSAVSKEPQGIDIQGRISEQLRLDLPTQEHHPRTRKQPPPLLRFAPARPTVVFDTYWEFAAKRQEIFFRRHEGAPPPWTNDPILKKHKFTNAYRASDRVSQYLIRKVIYEGDQSAEEVFFRTLLFKFFNRIATWEALLQSLGSISYRDYRFDLYDAILTKRMAEGDRVFSAAYIMPTGGGKLGFDRKHSIYLKLLESMMEDHVPAKITAMRTMRQVFELIRSYPLMGDFLAYQYTIDLNYSNLTNFSEMEFVIPGPGARDGIRKCFTDLGGLDEMDLIRRVADHQEVEFERLGIEFKNLWGRPLQLIDCQNLFCEVDKYARIAHPEVQGITGRTRIKQVYQYGQERLKYWYPPKWGINHLIGIESEDKNNVSIRGRFGG